MGITYWEVYFSLLREKLAGNGSLELETCGLEVLSSSPVKQGLRAIPEIYVKEQYGQKDSLNRSSELIGIFRV